MHVSLIVVDDFLDNAAGLREAALKLEYPEQEGPFPGRNSLQRIPIEGLTETVSDLTGERLRPLDPPQSHAKFRISLAGEKGSGRVHIDPGYWSGILYLSREGDCRGGTEFFRHVATGSDRAPLNEQELRAMGFSSYEAMRRQLIDVEGTDESKWEPVMTVPMRFNRLVLLRPWLWHTAGPGFGDGLANGRLIYVMFFQPAG